LFNIPVNYIGFFFKKNTKNSSKFVLAEKTFCAIAEKKTVKTKAIVSSATVNLAKSSWLIKCIENAKFIPWCGFSVEMFLNVSK